MLGVGGRGITIYNVLQLGGFVCVFRVEMLGMRRSGLGISTRNPLYSVFSRRSKHNKRSRGGWGTNIKNKPNRQQGTGKTGDTQKEGNKIAIDCREVESKRQDTTTYINEERERKVW